MQTAAPILSLVASTTASRPFTSRARGLVGECFKFTRQPVLREAIASRRVLCDFSIGSFARIAKVHQEIEGYTMLFRAEEIWALGNRQQLFSNFFSKMLPCSSRVATICSKYSWCKAIASLIPQSEVRWAGSGYC